ncbi:MAG: HDOD domain-containing protein, partial [Aeoliella sp.]
MKRILFVNEEANVLDGLRRMLRCLRTEWSMEFASSGKQALEHLNNTPCDVLVSDIRVADLEGAPLLSEARDRFPKTVRIALSGQTEQDDLLQVIGSAHQFIPMPCEAETIKAVIARACAVRDQLDNSSLGELVGQISSLPAIPTLYNQLVQELNSPDASVDSVGEIIAQDVGMTARVLQTVNSSFFGLQHRVTDPSHAAAMLGLELILPLVLGAGVIDQFDPAILKNLRLDTLMNHSLTVATGARRIASKCCDDEQLIADCMLAGILHDVGKLVLASNLTDSFREAIELATSSGIPLFQAEKQLFGACHADVGGALLELWGFPNSIVEAVTFHHLPSQSASDDFTLLTALHVSDLQAHHADPDIARACTTAQDDKYLARLNLEESHALWHET